MDRYRGFEVSLLCGAGGAEISGVDAAQPLGAETVSELRRALAEHCVIFLRDQELSPDQQKTFARHFGPLAQTPFVRPLAGTPRPVIDRMNLEINRIIQTPDGREQMLKFGLLATGTTPDELADVIRKGNIKAQ